MDLRNQYSPKPKGFGEYPLDPPLGFALTPRTSFAPVCRLESEKKTVVLSFLLLNIVRFIDVLRNILFCLCVHSKQKKNQNTLRDTYNPLKIRRSSIDCHTFGNVFRQNFRVCFVSFVMEKGEVINEIHKYIVKYVQLYLFCTCRQHKKIKINIKSQISKR